MERDIDCNLITVAFCQMIKQKVSLLPGNLDHTAKNTVISPNFLVLKICGKTQFPHSLG